MNFKKNKLDMKNKKAHKHKKLPLFGHHVHKIAVGLAVFSLFAFAVGVISAPDGIFKASVAIDDPNDNACDFTKTYIPQNTWQDFVTDLPDLEGPEDELAILGFKLICSEDEGCEAANCTAGDTSCKNGFMSKNSWTRTADRQPYSISEIKLLLVETSDYGDAIVTYEGEVDGRRGVIKDGQFTGVVVSEGSTISNIDQPKSNLSLFLKNTNTSKSDFKGDKEICGFAVFHLKTKYESYISGKIDGTRAGEENGIANAKVTLSPCPDDGREREDGEIIRTIPDGASCEIEANASGDYTFEVLPRRSKYTVNASRQ